MALTPDQEREWTAQLEGMGVQLARSELERGKIPPHWVHLTATWLSSKDKEAEAQRDASNAEQMEIARRASEAAARAATAAELQAIEARRANKRATIALVIATISIIATTVGTAVSIWISHIDARK
jgi:phage terminase Nu1 subunit (DNA packaging protein)